MAVISDLHLGDGGATDLFGHEDNEFLRFLQHLENNFEKVVLLGDIWETLTAPSPAGQLAELRRTQEAHQEIFQRFQRENYLYVHGNHDLVAGKQDKIPEEYALEVDGIRLLFSHGHQGDSLCRTARPLVELGVWIGAWIRRLGMDLVYTYLAQIESARTSNTEKCMVRRWAVNQATQRKVDIVVTGHTHVPVIAEQGSSLFLNSGTCAKGAISFLSLDTTRGDYAINYGY
ncbi:MAG: UDP-2,3-diacylglucosamine diphosphatase [Polyangiaceae bacterium]|nr:UDP-2,3-diacylglucosamine diphosphatase [Polyangiaceae bacterium]